jgi:mRNA-degrading endonuclease toxin of MazEF toxin-antitoxin module
MRSIQRSRRRVEARRALVTNRGDHRPLEQTGGRPVIVWQSDALNSVLQSVLVVPLTTNLERAHLAGTAMIEASDLGPPQDSVALAFQMRAVPKRALAAKMRGLTDVELAELEMATDEALGRLDPETA